MANQSDTIISTEAWPTAPITVPDRFKQLIERFFVISQSTALDSGRLFAEELFTGDGLFKTHETCVFKGHAGMSIFRAQELTFSPLQ